MLVSDDPFHFDARHEAGRIASHAAEVVVDEHGASWVSHCGWGMGGVYLAPLTWGEPEPRGDSSPIASGHQQHHHGSARRGAVDPVIDAVHAAVR